MNNENITISKKAGTIAITSQAEPANPTLSYSNISESWVRRNGNVLTIDANTGSSDRSFSLSVTATTIEDAAYDGIATDSKTFIITQEGTGMVTGNSISFDFAAAEDFGEFTMAVSGSGIYDESPANGTGDTSDLGSSSIPAGASIYLGVKNGTSGTRSIAIDYTASSPSYSYTSVSSNSWKWVSVTQASGKIFYVRVK